MIVKTWMEECGKFEPAGGPVDLRTCGMIVVSREMRQSDRKRKGDAGHNFSRWQSEQVAEKSSSLHTAAILGVIFLLAFVQYCTVKRRRRGLSGVVFAPSFFFNDHLKHVTVFGSCCDYWSVILAFLIETLWLFVSIFVIFLFLTRK